MFWWKAMAMRCWENHTLGILHGGEMYVLSLKGTKTVNGGVIYLS